MAARSGSLGSAHAPWTPTLTTAAATATLSLSSAFTSAHDSYSHCSVAEPIQPARHFVQLPTEHLRLLT